MCVHPEQCLCTTQYTGSTCTTRKKIRLNIYNVIIVCWLRFVVIMLHNIFEIMNVLQVLNTALQRFAFLSVFMGLASDLRNVTVFQATAEVVAGQVS